MPESPPLDKAATPGMDQALARRLLLAARDVEAREEMDRADCDPVKLERTYAQFPLINKVVSGWHAVYRQRIKPLLSSTADTTLLDIGCGGGDIAAALARWAARDGLRLAITAIDPDARAIDFARRHHARSNVEFRSVHSSELVAEGAVFDVVISNHLLHHLGQTELDVLLRDSERLARRVALHGDIARSPLAYALFSVGTLPFFPGSFIRRDGLTSIRRSYRAPELRAAVPADWQVEPAMPWRYLLLWSPTDAHA